MSNVVRSPSSSPAALGFRMPPESAPHAATWSAWPVDDALWEGQLEAVREDMANLLAAISRFEPVHLLVRDDEARDDVMVRLAARKVADDRIRLQTGAYQDVWLRDSGPAFVVGSDARTALVDFRFDGWGGKYAAEIDDGVPREIAASTGFERFEADVVLEGGAIEVGADGTVLTTRSCLLDGVRNPGMDAAGYEEVLRASLGASRVVWLEGGLVDDHTDGHVDTVVRFGEGNVILCTVPDADDTENERALRANLATLQNLERDGGGSYDVMPLPLPLDRSRWNGVRLPRSYANFCVVNGGVIVPTWKDPRDAEALDILQHAFPSRSVVGVPATALVTGGGAFHCVTQHQPLGGAWSGRMSSGRASSRSISSGNTPSGDPL